MPLLLACPKCKNQLKVADAAHGRQVKCPHCATVFLASKPAPAPVAAAPGKPETIASPSGSLPAAMPARGAETNSAEPSSFSLSRDAAPKEESPGKGVSVLGIISLVLGILGSIISLIPCIGMFGGLVAVIGLLLGAIGLIVSLKGKQSGIGFPIAGSAVSMLGMCIAGVWLAIATLWVKNVDEVVKAQSAKMTQERQAIREGSAIKITASALFQEYHDNAIAADGKYKGKLLEVTGQVERVDDAGLTATVDVKTEEDGFPVVCEFARDQKPELAALKPGAQVTIRGKGTGRDGDSPTLGKCVLMK